MAEKSIVSNVETYVPIARLEIGKIYRQIFLIEEVTYGDKMVTANGKPFAKVVLKDVTGNIAGRIWGIVEDLKNGAYVLMTIAVKDYQKQLNFSAAADHVVIQEEAPLNQFDYIKGASAGLLTAYAAEIEDEIAAMDDDFYRSVLSIAMHHLDLMMILKESPYGLSGALSYRGGLLVHTTHTLRIAKATCKQAKDLEMRFNPSLVVAGCILRNIGWHTTTQFQGGGLRSRDAFYMIGIDRASARYIDHLLLTCQTDLDIKISESKHQALENMCQPIGQVYTLEGQVVAYASQTSHMLNDSNEILQRKIEGTWVGQKLFIGHIQ